jgi:hypothetical protein
MKKLSTDLNRKLEINKEKEEVIHCYLTHFEKYTNEYEILKMLFEIESNRELGSDTELSKHLIHFCSLMQKTKKEEYKKRSDYEDMMNYFNKVVEGVLGMLFDCKGYFKEGNTDFDELIGLLICNDFPNENMFILIS